MNRSALPALLLAALALSPGCAHRRVMPRLPAPPDTIPGYVALLAARSTGANGTSRGRVAAAFLAPASLRLEILDPAGGTRAVLVSAEGGALYLDPGRRSYHAFPTGAGALEALVGIEAPSDLLARLILGPAAALEVLPCAGEGTTICRLPRGGELRLLDSSPPSAEIRDPGFDTVQVTWDRFDPASRDIPPGTEFRLPASGAVLRLEVRELRFTAPASSLFSLSPPAGFQPAPPPGR